MAEICWVVSSRIGAEAEANIIDAVAGGELQRVDLTIEDLRRTGELLHRYRDLHYGAGFSAADASTIALAERLDVHEVATLDLTDFRIVRPIHVQHLTLLP